MNTKIKLSNLFKWLISLIMVMGTFLSCEKSDERPGTSYPGPRTKYILLGKVVDKENNPIEGIEVSLGYKPYGSDYRDTTDNTGDYIVDYPLTSSHGGLWNVEFKDIKNNQFLLKNDSIEFVKYIRGYSPRDYGTHIAILNTQLDKIPM